MEAYTEEFYKQIQEGSRKSAREIVPLLVEWMQPKSVIDVGCGLGTWLSVFAAFGVTDVLGVDCDWVDQELLEIPKERFREFDLNQPFRIDRQFDLALSLEVAQHLPSERAETFVDSLTRLGPAVLFSAAIPFQGGVGHVNEQWPDYWARLFEERGFAVIDCIRKRVWRNDNVEYWFAQNALLFVRGDCLDRYPLLQKEREQTRCSQLSMVHPRKYLELAEWRHRCYQAAEELAALVPSGETLLLVDEQQLWGLVPMGCRALPFLEREGEYWGPPEDDAVAIRELERLRQAGASHIVFAWPAFWWLEEYSGLHRHLRERSRCVLENNRLVIFDLRRGGKGAV